MAIESFGGENPQLNDPAFIAASADLIGRVTLHPGSNVWYNTTIRGDVSPIEIGEGSNVQDNCCLHVDYEYGCKLFRKRMECAIMLEAAKAVEE